MSVSNTEGLVYYHYEVKPHNLVTMTAVGTRVFILTVYSDKRQWKKTAPELRKIAESFYVPTDNQLFLNKAKEGISATQAKMT